MNFYHLQEYIKLLKKQRLEREIFLAHGMSDEAIQELFRLDERQLDSDARFYHHMQSYIEDLPNSEVQGVQDEYFGVMDNIESSELHQALSMLTPDELEILIRHTIYGESLKDIATEKGQSDSTLRTRYERIRKKIKKYHRK